MSDPDPGRRLLLLAPALAALPGLLCRTPAAASPLDPTATMISTPDEIKWQVRPDWPKDSIATASLFSEPTKEGIYYYLVKWFPGYMSAPHFYATDRLCVVLSGTWWCNSGADFDPVRCVPVQAGSFVRRVATTPHYDGVVANGAEPAVIAICGIGPVKLTYIDPSQPGWRKV
jgi:hypothetical protein